MFDGGVPMSIVEIIAGVTLIISCVMMVIIITVQQPKGSGLSGAIMGGDTQTQSGGRRGRSNDARLSRLTKIFAITFFAVTLIVDVVILATGR